MYSLKDSKLHQERAKLNLSNFSKHSLKSRLFVTLLCILLLIVFSPYEKVVLEGGNVV